MAQVQRQMFARRSRDWGESDTTMLRYVAETAAAIEQ